jgi:DTW domain-containing protein YfiP
MLKVILALLHICLLTHKNELDRSKTNTGQLVTSEYLNNHEFESSIICWSGRDDNVIIEQRIKSFSNLPILLWTQGTKNITAVNDNSNLEHENVYIVIDGTWQEAERIYRKGPELLRNLPKLFITPSSPSRYKLRRNFGYVNKYSSDNEVKSLLCTAEICATILQREGLIHSSQRILDALDNLQSHNKNEI